MARRCQCRLAGRAGETVRGCDHGPVRSHRTEGELRVRNAVALALFAIGYPVAIVVIIRWLPVVRERRLPWFAAHEAAVSAIVVGQALRMRTRGVIINGA